MVAAEKHMQLIIPLNPVPASRPRVGRWGVHYAKTYATWMKQAALHLDFDYVTPYFPTGPVAIMTEFVVGAL